MSRYCSLDAWLSLIGELTTVLKLFVGNPRPSLDVHPSTGFILVWSGTWEQERLRTCHTKFMA